MTSEDPADESAWEAWLENWSGWVVVEGRFFPETARQERQDHVEDFSVAVELEYNHTWDNDRQSFRFVPFARYDQHDSHRSHIDIRELIWVKAERDWELRLGIGKVFWGVTESQHLIDIINQTDLVENPDGEDKLGQPMANLSLFTDAGTFGVFVLPGFRERTFPSADGRLRSTLPVETDRPIYDSAAEEWHVDYALRWFHTFDALDLGVYHFYGTSREPVFEVEVDNLGRPSLHPRYDIIHQTGLDAQLTLDNWLWKLEAMTRQGQGRGFFALVGGFEYTCYGIAGSAADLGVLLEYSFDDRADDSTNPFQNDLFAGFRLVLNDTQSTELLAGVTVDLDSGAQFWNVEASRRLGQNWKLTLEARFIANTPDEDPLNTLRQDDHLLLELKFFF